MGKNAKHMRWWPRPWEYREAEAWLEDMAAKGWRLESIGLVFAKFVQVEPAEIKYRCVLHNSSLFASDVDAFVMSYLDAGWKSIGYIKNTKVFSGGSELDDPTDLIRQEKYARKRILAEVIWLLITILVFVAGFSVFAFDTGRYLNTVLNREITFSIVALWLINYWAFSLVDLLAYRRRKPDRPKIRPGKYSSAAWVIHVVIIVLLFPGPKDLIEAFVEERAVDPRVKLEEVINISQAQFQSDKSGICYAKDGYGVLYPYHRMDIGHYELIPLNREADEPNFTLFTLAYYKALFGTTARQLGEMLSGYKLFVHSYIKLDEPMSQSDHKYGFDRVWKSDDGDRHAVVAVKGNAVYYFQIDGPITSDQIVLYLQRKAGISPAVSD